VIPYLKFSTISIGPVTLPTFGLLVATGVLVGSLVTIRRGREYGLDGQMLRRSVLWAVFGGFIVAHITEVLFYIPYRLKEDPWVLLRLSEGISSYGGFFGGLLGLFIFSRIHRQSFARYTDIISLGLLTGWVFGRLGCSVVHDHPGVHSDFFLAVAYPDGPRHDLGLYEFIFTVVLYGTFEIIRRRPLPPGHIALLMGLLYAPVRFMLDFLRAFDARYFSLTPAQYASAGLFFMCLILIKRSTVSSGQSMSQ
jgi:phosphatidylglycerol:prolipoprotein diacylglycerol transferase